MPDDAIKLPDWLDVGDYYPSTQDNSDHHCVLLIDQDPATGVITVTAAEIDNELVTA